MTIKVLLVDDEPIICEGLRKTVDWEALGAEVIDEAYDGEEALSIVAETPVDLVLSDIRMPEMDGLALAEQIHQNHEQTKMIIISGYDEFDYAKQAIKLGVKDYLLKPVDIDDLKRIVINLSKSIQKEREEARLANIKQVLYSLAIGESIDFDATNLSVDGFQIIGSQIREFADVVADRNEEEKRVLKLQWIKALENKIKTKNRFVSSTFVDENILITFCDLPKEEQLNVKEVQWMASDIEAVVGAPMSICLTAFTEHTANIKHAYTHVVDSIKHCHARKEHVIYPGEEKCPSTVPYPTRLEKLLMDLSLVEEKKLIELVNQLFNSYEKHGYYLEDIYNMLKTVEQHVIEEFSLGVELGIHKGINLTYYNSYGLLKAVLLEDIKKLVNYQHKANQVGPKWLVDKATYYIRQHYSCDLKAAEVADYINVTPNYFSQLFKKETNKSFNDYLHEIRVQRAKELLKETSYRIFEVAELVGYKEYKYFVANFKRIASITPTQYRNIASHQKEEGNMV